MVIGTKMLYIIQDEKDISLSYGTDCAYYILGKEIRLPTTEGLKSFVLASAPNNSNLQLTDIKKELVNHQSQLDDLAQNISAIKTLFLPTKKEDSINEGTETTPTRTF